MAVLACTAIAVGLSASASAGWGSSGGSSGGAGLTSTQTWSGGNTLYGSTAFYGQVYGVRNSTTIIKIPTYSSSSSGWSGCIPGSTAAFTVNQIGSVVVSTVKNGVPDEAPITMSALPSTIGLTMLAMNRPGY